MEKDKTTMALIQFVIAVFCTAVWIMIAIFYILDPEKSVAIKVAEALVALLWVVLAFIRGRIWIKLKREKGRQ